MERTTKRGDYVNRRPCEGKIMWRSKYVETTMIERGLCRGDYVRATRLGTM